VPLQCLFASDAVTRTSIAQGAQINQIIRQSETSFSTVWILDALRSRLNSLHVAIDPFEITLYGGIGLQQIKRLNAAVGFEWVAERSIHALSRLIKSEAKFDFIFIDGNHRFDDVLVDFYLSDEEGLWFLTICGCHPFGPWLTLF